jgi:large conductance mechanosensitive channel
MSFLQEFKQFALKGNVVDLAVGIIIGGAFGGLVNSAVNDLVMPVVGRLTAGNIDFSRLYIPLSDQITSGMSLTDIKAKSLPAIAYGNFLTLTLNFVIVAFAVFLLVKAINTARHAFLREEEVQAAATPPAPSGEEKLLAEIRDLLAARTGNEPPKLGS